MSSSYVPSFVGSYLIVERVETLEHAAGHVDEGWLLAEDHAVNAQHAGEQTNEIQREHVHHAHQEEEGVTGVLPAVLEQGHADGHAEQLGEDDKIYVI
jgi:hypothetical protein